MCDIVLRKRGKDDTDETADTVDTERFISWVEDYLCPNLGNYWNGEKRSIVILDNATIHTDIRVTQLIEAKGAIVIYTSPYSPDLNPIEKCFHQYKSVLKRRKFINEDYLVTHFVALNSVSFENMCNYYRQIGCIKNVPSGCRNDYNFDSSSSSDCESCNSEYNNNSL